MTAATTSDAGDIGVDDFVRLLRDLANYHMDKNLVERLANAQRDQQRQGEALAKAADRIEQLEAELANCKKQPTAV